MAEIATVEGVTAPRATLAAETVNRAILALTVLSTRPDGGVDRCFEVSVVLHGGPEGVRPGLPETPSGEQAWGIGDLADRSANSAPRPPARSRVVPVWVTPTAEGEPHAEAALAGAARLARGWARRHPRSGPPVLVTIGGGAIAGAGRALADHFGPGAKGGGALVAHCLLNDEAGGPVRFPADPADIAGDSDALRLFDLASPAPDVGPGARALLRNADAAEGLDRLLRDRVRVAPRGFLGWLGLGRRVPTGRLATIPWSEAVGGALEAALPPLSPPIGRAADERIEIRWCLTPKDGSRPRDCEDAIGFNLAGGRFCVADGAGEGAFSRLWARTLASGWRVVGHLDQDDEALRAGVRDLAEILRERIDRQRQRIRERQGGRLFWFQTEARVAEFAAFIGLAFDPDGSWRALAVGDCCLFLERDDSLWSFPLTRPEEFQGGAYLAPSAIDEDVGLSDHVRRVAGERRTGDRFLLMSDAMACWYLTYPRRRARLREVLSTRDRRALGGLIARERQAGRLRNDDIAMLFIYSKT